MGITTKLSDVKTLPIDFQEAKVKIDVENISNEGEDHSNKLSNVSPTKLFKTFPFSFMLNENRIYGDFVVSERKNTDDGKSICLVGVVLYNLTSFFVKFAMQMFVTSTDDHCKCYEIIKETTSPNITIMRNEFISEIIKEKLPNNDKHAKVSTKFDLDETIPDSRNTSIKCEIIIYNNLNMNITNKSNLKTYLDDDAIHQLDQDKNFTLICDNEQFHFNKSLLAMVSEVFGRMIQTSDSKEARLNTVEIEDFYPETIKAFQKVVFSKDEVRDEDLTPELLLFAHKYFIKPLVAKVKAKLMGSLSNDNIFDIIKTAYLIDDEEMFCEASDYLLKNMKQLESTEAWKIFGENHPACMIKALTYMCKK